MARAFLERVELADRGTDALADFLSLLGSSGAAGADGPDGLVGNDDLADLVLGDTSQPRA